jgi:hypothetical protein
MTRITLALPLLLASVTWTALADDKPPADSIQVEVRGTLQTGIVAIGGETTGTIIKSGNVTWELDLGGDANLIAQATKLNMKKALVRGAYYKKPGIEIAERHIVRVKSLAPADAP